MNDKEKIVLPKKLQISMLNFFLRTSIPRKKLEHEKTLSNKEKDR